MPWAIIASNTASAAPDGVIRVMRMRRRASTVSVVTGLRTTELDEVAKLLMALRHRRHREKRPAGNLKATIAKKSRRGSPSKGAP